MSTYFTRNFSKSRRPRAQRQFIAPLEALEKSAMPVHTALQTAKLFMHLHNELKEFLQNDIGTYCHIVRLDAEQLILAVPNAAIASKLRQQAPSIAAYLAQRGYTISKMNIKISAELNQLSTSQRPSSSSPTHTYNHSLIQCHKAFQQFIERNPQSPLTPILHNIMAKSTHKKTA